MSDPTAPEAIRWVLPARGHGDPLPNERGLVVMTLPPRRIDRLAGFMEAAASMTDRIEDVEAVGLEVTDADHRFRWYPSRPTISHNALGEALTRAREGGEAAALGAGIELDPSDGNAPPDHRPPTLSVDGDEITWTWQAHAGKRRAWGLTRAVLLRARLLTADRRAERRRAFRALAERRPDRMARALEQGFGPDVGDRPRRPITRDLTPGDLEPLLLAERARTRRRAFEALERIEPGRTRGRERSAPPDRSR